MRYGVKRTYEWSPAIAYTVGLMASDGSLSKDGRHLDLTSVDIEQLENFVEAIGRPLPISPKKAGGNDQYKRVPAYRVQFSDVAYYDFLSAVGLTPNKSITMPALRIPDQYHGHFLRGLFDGDGTTYAYYDLRWRSSYMYYVGFTSGSLKFLAYLAKTNARLYGVVGGSIRTFQGAYGLFYAKKDSYRLYAVMYSEAGRLYLPRKRNKLEGFIIVANSGIILKNARVL